MRNHDSKIKTGRTIGEKREQLETANEREIIRKKAKRKSVLRITITTLLFLIIIGVIITAYLLFFGQNGEVEVKDDENSTVEDIVTIEIIDEDSTAGGKITSRMAKYIAQAETDFRDLGYTPVKAVIPANTIREVDFYLADHAGYIKMLIDRDTAVSAEDADRMLRYLASIGVSDFQYIDVRIDGRAFWK